MAKQQNKQTKEKKIKEKQEPPRANGVYFVQHLVDGNWSEPEEVRAKNRKTLMNQFSDKTGTVKVRCA